MPSKLKVKIDGCSHYFLIDSGSCVSLFPYSAEFRSNLLPTSIALTNVSGSKVECYGEILLTLDVRSLRRSFLWVFVVAEVLQPIIGIDFLKHFNLFRCCSNIATLLTDPSTNLSTELLSTRSQQEQMQPHF